jgi:hypothetical protein
MADYFTNFSFILPLPDQAAQQYALDVYSQASAACAGDELRPGFPPQLAEVIEDWHFEADAETSPGKWGLWLHSSSGGIDSACAFVQHLLQRFHPEGSAGFEWSHDCTKPRLDAFGGGAAFITPKKIKSTGTADWLHKQAARAPNQPQKGGSS